MPAEENRHIALQWIKCLIENRLDDLIALGAPNATWWVSGQKETSPFTGTMAYAERAEHMKEVFKGLKASSTFTIKGVTTEDDIVVIEGSPKFEVEDGRIYENDNVLKFTIRDGKVQSLREYLDLFAVLKYMGASA
jgi:ketosteroid isomerase-like protein